MDMLRRRHVSSLKAARSGAIPDTVGAISQRAMVFSSTAGGRARQEDVWNLLESKAWHDGSIVADACYDTFKSTGHLYGTAFVARDTLQIVDALNQDGKLRFWGHSYSTVLGQIFTAMFPDRVGRMLLDSVVLADDYFSGALQTAIRQTDSSLNNFFSECIAAGPEKCPFANQTGPDTTPQDLTAALAEVFQELIDILPDNFPLQYWWQPGGLSLLNQLEFNIFNGLYNPTSFTILMAQI